MKVSDYLSSSVIEYMQKAIAEANGNEVFFTGRLDGSGIVKTIVAGARGAEHTVPVNFNEARQSDVLIHNHPSGNLTPSQADLGVASRSSEVGVGFYIINNDVTDIYVVMEPVLPKELKLIEPDEAGYFISNGGPLSKLSEKFEERPVQIELLKNITAAFNENKLGVFEAGTGVGKSYAYLIPAALWALENKEKVVISTGTINLQQQLCEKDIPFVEKILGKEIKYVLMKGRQNYVCLRRLNDATSVLDLFEDETEGVKEVAEWALNSETGSKSDLPFVVNENVWTKINSESDACMGMRCPFHNECFVIKTRKEAAAANLIIVNHHLLFADIESRMNGAGYDDAAVLPPYRRIVFDEAHGIESAATSFFSESFVRFKLNKLVSLMYRKRKNSESGYLCTLAILSSNEEKAANAWDITSEIKNAILNYELSCKDLLGYDYTKRLYAGTAREFGPVIVAVSALAKAIGSFVDLITEIMDGIDDDDKDIPAFWESKIILRRLESYVLLLKNFCAWDEKKENVYWIQKKKLSEELARENGDSEYVVLTETPLDISYLMNAGVYDEMSSVVFTSATLKSGRDFYYWMNRTGISLVEKERVICREFESPFPYKTNMLFGVPSDAPMMDNFSFQQYIEQAIPKLIYASEGRTLVLFTSYESLKSAYGVTKAICRNFPGRIMRQGEDYANRLLEAFKEEKESVLFATDSFWQGVDIPGESLSQVIIVKLPFTVPNDPVFVARSEAIEQRGGSSFMELSVPDAVIKFRQGVGRLIRRSDDKGAVIVLDRRIYEKRYGSYFIAGVPECKKVYEPLSELAEHVKKFIFD